MLHFELIPVAESPSLLICIVGDVLIKIVGTVGELLKGHEVEMVCTAKPRPKTKLYVVKDFGRLI